MPTKLVVYIPDDLAEWVNTHKDFFDPCGVLEKRLGTARSGRQDGGRS